MHTTYFLLILSAVATVLTGCSRQDSDSKTATADTQIRLGPNEVLVSVDGKELTYAQAARQVERRLGGPPPTSMAPDRINMIQRRTFAAVIDDFIRRELLLAEARRRGIAPEEENITQTLQTIEKTRREGAPPPAGMYYDGPDSLQQEVVAGLTIEALLTQVLPPFPQPSEEDVSTYLERYPELRTMPAKARARHIFLALEPNAETHLVEERKADLEAIRTRLLEGADFAQTANVVSQDATAASGGNLGVFTKGRSDPILEQAVFSQPIQEIGPIARSTLGLHIIQVLERTEERTATRQEITNIMHRNQRAEALTHFINELRTQTEIRHSPALQPLPNTTP